MRFVKLFTSMVVTTLAGNAQNAEQGHRLGEKALILSSKIKMVKEPPLRRVTDGRTSGKLPEKRISGDNLLRQTICRNNQSFV